MPVYYVFIVIIVILLVVSLILNLLTNPFVWLIIAALMVYSMIKRYLYQKQLEDYNKEFQKKAEEKKRAYQSGEAYRQGSDDIIDVDYKEVDDDK